METRTIQLNGGPRDGETLSVRADFGTDFWDFPRSSQCATTPRKVTRPIRPDHYTQDPSDPTQYHYQERK